MSTVTKLKPGKIRPRCHRRKARPGIRRESGRIADENDSFVAENYAALKTSGLVEAGVPAELGGGGANVTELADMLRTLAHHCGSTALAFAMHTPSRRGSVLALDAPESGCRGATAEARRG